MAAQGRNKARLRSYSKSMPNFAALMEEDSSWNTTSRPSLLLPSHVRTRPAFAPGVASEPVSEEEEEEEHSHHSSFEREYLSRSVSASSGSGSSTSEELDDRGQRALGNESSSQSRLSQSTSLRLPPPRPLLSHTSRSQSYIGPSAFAPPFYNRPPTPLPPSPSLTSLLRPRPFSAVPSRAETPESSDTEATTHTLGTAHASATTLSAAAVAQSALTATTVPRASPKVPTYEYYGFVLYLGSSVAFGVYLLWSYLPTPFLHQLGIYYYPDRWWSLAVPAWLVMLVCYIFVALACWNAGVLTLGLDRIECLVDDKGRVAVIDAQGRIVREDRPGKALEQRAKKGDGHNRAGRARSSRDEGYGRLGIGGKHVAGEEPVELDWRSLWNEGTDAVMDIPIGGVCEILYGDGREDDDDIDGG